MRKISMLIAFAVNGLPGVALASDDIPLVAIGLPFETVTPEPVAAEHPLYHLVSLDEIESLPPTIKSSSLNFIAAAKGSSVSKGLVESFRRMNMLAAKPEQARFKLVTRWVGSRTPFRIATRNTGTATLRYTLTRIDNGQILFDREITTSAKGSGVDAGLRDNGIVRAAIAANFASAANCLDDAAYGRAASDCALTPKFSVSVSRR